MNEPMHISKALDNLLTAVSDFARQRREQAQAGLERERNAYWIRKNAEKVRRRERSEPRQPVPNRKDMRANQSGGMIWSQRHRPARPSNRILRQYKPLGFVDETAGAEQ